RPIRVIVDSPAGLKHEILTGAIRQDVEIAVVDPSNQDELADVLVIADVSAARWRDLLRQEGKVLALDGHDQRLDMYELRFLGHAVCATDLTEVIRALTRTAAIQPARGWISRLGQVLVTLTKRRAP